MNETNYEFFLEEFDGVGFTACVQYAVFGTHHRATLTSPEEFPEMEWHIESIWYEDGTQVKDEFMLTKLTQELQKKEHMNEIEDLCWELSRPDEFDTEREREEFYA